MCLYAKCVNIILKNRSSSLLPCYGLLRRMPHSGQLAEKCDGIIHLVKLHMYSILSQKDLFLRHLTFFRLIYYKLNQVNTNRNRRMCWMVLLTISPIHVHYENLPWVLRLPFWGSYPIPPTGQSFFCQHCSLLWWHSLAKKKKSQPSGKKKKKVNRISNLEENMAC